MRIVADGKTYTFDPDKILNTELIDVERAIGMTAPEFEVKLNAGSVMAITALIWIIRKRTERGLVFDDVVFEATNIDMSADEQGKAPELDPSDSPAPESQPSILSDTSSPYFEPTASAPGS